MEMTMKRPVQTLLVFATMTAVCSPALATGGKKNEEQRFVLTSAVETSHRTVNTAAAPDAPISRPDVKDNVFAIGLEALKWVGASSRQVGVPYPDLWCADFINFVLRRTGHPTTNSRAAKSFLDYGKRIDSPRVGAIVVLTRGKDGGHVGIVRGTDGDGNPIVISGNHGNKVWESKYPKHRVLGYVIPPETN
jgi:uncharacterized protein (TIGR02594 family)